MENYNQHRVGLVRYALRNNLLSDITDDPDE